MLTSMTHYLSPLYDYGRRHLGIKPAVLQRVIAADGTARAQGRNVTITYTVNGGPEQVINAYRRWPGSKRKLARWTLRFNERVLTGDKRYVNRDQPRQP